MAKAKKAASKAKPKNAIGGDAPVKKASAKRVMVARQPVTPRVAGALSQPQGRGASRLGTAGVNVPSASPFKAMGTPGIISAGGFIQSFEQNPKWQTQEKYRTIADIAVNVSIVAASVHYFLNLIAHPKWNVTPANDSAEARKIAESLERVMYDMRTPWPRIVRRAAMFRFHGFSVQEWVAKRNQDGLIGFLDVESRPQATIRRWDIADDGNVRAIIQQAPMSGNELVLPRVKCIYMVEDTLTDHPEGIGMFRHLAEPFDRLKQYLELEARAYERDLRGTPIGRAPLSMIEQAKTSGHLTAEQAKALVAGLEAFVKAQVKKSDTGLMLDSQPYISQANDGDKVASVQQWGVELLKGDAAGLTEIAGAIDRIQREMARILGTESLMMGGESQGGSRALSQDKSKNLYLIANAVLESISTTFDNDLIDPFMYLNGFDEELKPWFSVEDVAFKDVAEITAALRDMATAGAVLSPDDPVVNDVRELLGVSRLEDAALANSMAAFDSNKPMPAPDPSADNENDFGGAGDLANETRAQKRARLFKGRKSARPFDKAFDPNQARDDHGRWVRAGGEVVDLYHGTAAEAVDSIVKDGLMVVKGKQVDRGEGNRTFRWRYRGKSVYVTPLKADAEAYAGQAANAAWDRAAAQGNRRFGPSIPNQWADHPNEGQIGPPTLRGDRLTEAAVIHFRVPKEVAAQFEPDPLDNLSSPSSSRDAKGNLPARGGLMVRSGRVDAKYIAGWTKITSINGETHREHFKKADDAEAMVDLYMVIACSPALSKAFDEGKHPRRPKGDPKGGQFSSSGGATNPDNPNYQTMSQDELNFLIEANNEDAKKEMNRRLAAAREARLRDKPDEEDLGDMKDHELRAYAERSGDFDALVTMEQRGMAPPSDETIRGLDLHDVRSLADDYDILWAKDEMDRRHDAEMDSDMEDARINRLEAIGHLSPEMQDMVQSGVDFGGSSPDEVGAVWDAHMDHSYDHFARQMAGPGHNLVDVTIEADGDHRLNIQAQLKDAESGLRVGRIERTFDFEDGSVHHDYFKLVDSAQGAGRAKSIIGSQIEFYNRMGNINKVELLADIDVGRYAWAKYGFKQSGDSNDTWRVKADRIAARLDDMNMEQKDRDNIARILKTRSPSGIWALSDYKSDSGTRLGRVLLNDDGDWYGHLSFSDPAAMARFREYIGAKK